MIWESWGQFWAMGGYACYVWGSMGVTALLLILEVAQARWSHSVVLSELKAEQVVAQLPVEELM